MLMYLLKSGACLAILLLFYQLFLERESIHVFKRYYLLAALALSFVVPAIVFVEYIDIEPMPEMYPVRAQVTQTPEIVPIDPVTDQDMLNLPRIFGWIYAFGVFLFGYKFYRNLRMIVQRIRKNPKYRSNTITKVLLNELIAPHTFFSYIFLNREKFTSNQIPHAVMLHEEAHAKQKHSLDVLIIEVLQVIFWFNPLIFLTKRCIKLNHEFLADQAVVHLGVPPVTYQHILLAFSSNALAPQFSNSIHYSSIKKRFTVMKTKTSKKSFLLRTLLLLPLLTVLLFGFSETKIILTEAVLNMESIEPNEAVGSLEQEGATKKELAAYNALATKYNKQPKESRVVPNSDLKILENIYGKMSSDQKEAALAFPECSPNQDGASRKEMAEYNKLAKYYNAMPKNKMKILKKDVERLEYIYALMSDTQKADAAPFPDFPEPPSPPKAPKEPKEVKAPKMMKGEKSNIPPPPPPFAPPKDRKNHSEELLIAYDEFQKEGEAYFEAVSAFTKSGKGTTDELHKMYEEVMVLYDDYVELAAKEGLMTPRPRTAPQAKMEEALKEAQEKQRQVEEVKLKEREKKWVEQEAKLREQEIAIEQEEIKLEKQEILLQVQEEKLIEREIKLQEMKEKLQVPTPPLPPEPVSPLDHIIEMAKKGAAFYYEGKEITSDKAIELLKNNDALNIDSRVSNTKRPIVKISKEPIVIEN